MIDQDALDTKLEASPAPRVTPDRLDAVIAERQFFRPTGTLTICVLTLANGFTVTGESACASPENYDQEIGERIAFDQARNKIWALEGYALKDRLAAAADAAASQKLEAMDQELHPTGFLTVADLARLTHEGNRALCLVLGDDSQLAWDDAPDWQQSSAMNGVLFHLNDPDATPERSHESWLEEKIEGGWVYGDVKDPDASPPTHPCIKPYAELPPEQQAKDHLFRAIVHGMKRFLA